VSQRRSRLAYAEPAKSDGHPQIVRATGPTARVLWPVARWAAQLLTSPDLQLHANL
jgi:hypothetical protein